MKQTRMLQFTGILLIVRSLTFLYVALEMTDFIWWPLCCPYCPAPGVWEFYSETLFPMIRNMRDIELELWPYTIALFLIGAVLAFIAGIMGLVNWRNPKRANRCLIWGIAAATVYPFLFWWGAARVAAHPRAFWFVRLEVGIGFLLVYTLYILSAYRLKQAWQESEISE